MLFAARPTAPTLHKQPSLLLDPPCLSSAYDHWRSELRQTGEEKRQTGSLTRQSTLPLTQITLTTWPPFLMLIMPMVAVAAAAASEDTTLVDTLRMRDNTANICGYKVAIEFHDTGWLMLMLLLLQFLRALQTGCRTECSIFSISHRQ